MYVMYEKRAIYSHIKLSSQYPFTGASAKGPFAIHILTYPYKKDLLQKSFGFAYSFRRTGCEKYTNFGARLGGGTIFLFFAFATIFARKRITQSDFDATYAISNSRALIDALLGWD
jgi:hypothetical protein